MKWIIFVVCSIFGAATSQNPCITPNGESAKCISIYKCKVFIDALKVRTPETIRFMRASQCGYREDPLVCCGSVAKYDAVATPPPTSSPTDHANKELLPKKGRCGVQGILDRIIGGNVTGLDEFPWTTLLEYKNPNNGRSAGFACGGVLINEKYVLTAGHCVEGPIKAAVGDIFRVRLGEHNTKTKDDCVTYGDGEDKETVCSDPPVDVEIEEAIVHQQYVPDSPSQHHDLALLRLRNAVKTSDYIRPICLPLRQETTAVGKNVTVAGWGDKEDMRPSDVKLKADIPIFLQSRCAELFRPAKVSIVKTQLCAGGKQGVDSCSGDSGGPLMAYLPGTSDMYVEGIVSFGPRTCGLDGIPGVYTRVTEYLGWILDSMRP